LYPLLAVFLPELGRSSAVTFFYATFDTVLRSGCHDIFGYIAMQQTQFNFVKLGTKSVLAAMLFLAAIPAFAATMAHPAKPDPLLDGAASDPCMAQSEYVPGRDADGHPVTPADPDAGRVPVPDSIAIPLAGNSPSGARLRPAMGDSAYVSLDGKKLEPLINPPACH
jgi:hypothetical protein